MSDIRDMTDEQIMQLIGSSAHTISLCNQELQNRKRRDSESMSTSSSSTAPKTPRTDNESDQSVLQSDESDVESDDSDDVGDRGNGGAIIVRKTVKCNIPHCTLCKYVNQSEFVPNMLYATRPLHFKISKEDFTCHFPKKGVYAMICINPNCPDKYVGPIYFGISGEGKATLQSRMNDHIGQFDNTGAAGVDCHFAVKETQYMHRFGTLDRLRGMNGNVSVASLPSRSIGLSLPERGDTVSVRQTHKLVMSRKNQKSAKKVPTVHFQTLVVAFIKANPALTSFTAIDVADFIHANYPHYYSKSTNMQNSLSNRLKENVSGKVKETSSYYSNWFTLLEKGSVESNKPSKFLLNNNFDEEVYAEGLKALVDFEKSEQERDSASPFTTPSPRTVRRTYVNENDSDSD
ncbi:uncharacterized protein LOC110851840 isoform X2 [Folsomia candida]|uniref:uncharacterized protein LOC110851840 isoform X2 n=1 Tax=Folsomia candida TaxID=158441 RepID=UPI000B8EF6F6|nr:uncharacterized protein LOC110851840 isoform X2 [Folsomia candida]